MWLNVLLPTVAERIPFLAIDFEIRRFEDADFEKMSAFSCGVSELDDFFREEVRECVEKHYLSAYCAEVPNGAIIAAFTLMNDAVMIAGETEKSDFIYDLKFEVENEIIDFFKRQTSYPAINIGHLGVSIPYQNRGIGTEIIDFVVYSFSQYRQTGCQFVTVDALKNEKTIKFYLDNGFTFQTNKDATAPTRRMYRILNF